ncbi:AP-3 complex subunit sigma-2-like [Schistocerca gregaria]|uniref:AP-3 complex subunit sigma-2-like n=1 Tax=Schistocerca gregaria TaxID=7010 RepID=UPI00211DF146|nr:AP-3 complex subunit sigma-2-like [Schistocerca gregaria]
MIDSIIILNNYGNVRLSRFYTTKDCALQQKILKETFKLISGRGDNMCNFIEGSHTDICEEGKKIVYRNYATLFFVFFIDSGESELGILDIIQMFVEVLDSCYQDVCELDLVFNFDKINYILDEIVQGGLIVETRKSAVIESVKKMKLKRQ